MRLLALLIVAALSLMQPAWAQETPTVQDGQATAGQEARSGLEELLRLLDDEAVRAELLELLGQSQVVDAASPPPDAAAETTLARQIAEYTRGVAEGMSATANALVATVVELGEIFTGTAGPDAARLGEVATELVLLGVALFAAFLVFRLAAARIQGVVARRVVGSAWPARAGGVLVAAAADLAAVLLAWAIGYFVALNFLAGPGGRMGINQTLLLNAFLVVEIAKVGLRVIFEPRDSPLRFLPMSETTAAYWYFWFARVVSLVGYAFMFVAPILADNVSPVAGRALQVLAMVTAVLIGIIVVLQNKLQVRAALTARAANGHADAMSRVLALIGRYWHLVAIFYLVAVLVVWLANPAHALPFMLAATAQSVVAIVVGAVVVGFISRFIHVGVRLPDDVKHRLPLLETRLHAFVPRIMQVVRSIVLIAVAIAIAQAWALVDFVGWIGTEAGQNLTGSLISAIVIVLVGVLIYLAMSSWVEYRLNPNYGSVPSAREKTLLALFRNAFTIALAVFVAMTALAQIGVNIAPLLAGAGVLGLAIGFGAQKFVQDIITGIFIQLENIMNEGDVVEVAGRTGVVERLTIRSVSIRSLDGTVHLIPFSSVESVSNMMKGFSFHVAEFGVAYREDIGEVKEAMREAFDLLMETDHRFHILEPLDIQGVTEFGDSAVMVRGRIKTRPGMQWATGRAYNEFVKQVFDRHGIEIPFPHVTLYMGEDKKGGAPALRLKREAPGDRAVEPEGGTPPAIADQSVPEPSHAADEMSGKGGG